MRNIYKQYLKHKKEMYFLLKTFAHKIINCQGRGVTAMPVLLYST